MRVVALLAILLLVPLASATHPFPTPEERLREGEKLSVHLIFRGSATAMGSQMKDDTRDGLGSVYEDEHRWRSTWNWTATGDLGPVGGQAAGLELGGNTSVDFLRAGRRETVTLQGPEQETRVTTSESVTECAVAGPLQGFTFASFRQQGGEVVITLRGPSVAGSGACTSRLHQTDTHGEPTRHSDPAGDLVDVAFSTEENAEGDITLRVPIDAGKTILRGNVRASLPAENEAFAGRLCGRVYASVTDLTVRCEADEVIEVRLFVGQCDALEEAAETHAKELRATIAAPPGDLTESAIRAWAATIAARVDVVLANERAHELAGCVPPIEGVPALALQGTVAVRDALGRAAAQGKLTRTGLDHLLGVEREVQVQQGPPPEGEVETGVILALQGAVARVEAANAQVSVHSPVALRAVSLDGRAVGWNASANASEATVEGASSEGVAGGEQRLTLPPGGYQIEIAEQRFAAYLLVFLGPDGREETHLVRATPGGLTRIPFGLVETGEGYALRLYSPTRTASTPADATPPTEGEEGDRASPAAPVVLALLVAALIGTRRGRGGRRA